MTFAKSEVHGDAEGLQSVIDPSFCPHFASKSECLTPNQLGLCVEDIETEQGAAREAREARTVQFKGDSRRKTYDDALPALCERDEQLALKAIKPAQVKVAGCTRSVRMLQKALIWC